MGSSIAKESVREIAERQCGRISYWQLIAAGCSKNIIRTWIRSEQLIRCLPRVYALGNAARSYTAELWEAVLYAGPGAMLSHLTAAACRKLIRYPPRLIHVSTPRRAASLPGIHVHARRPLPRELVNGLPVTTVPQTLLDLAALDPQRRLVSHALAQLDHENTLDFHAIAAIAGKGRPGSARLRDALRTHDPNLARLGGRQEEIFYAALLAHGVDPLPQLNVTITDGITVDAAWIGLKLIAEIDDYASHHSVAQLAHDAEREMVCRRLGFDTVRYRDTQLANGIDGVVADVIDQLDRRRSA